MAFLRKQDFYRNFQQKKMTETWVEFDFHWLEWWSVTGKIMITKSQWSSFHCVEEMSQIAETIGSTSIKHRLDMDLTLSIWINVRWTSMQLSLLFGMYTQIAKFMGPTWGPPGSLRPHMGPMLAPWTLLSGYTISDCGNCCIGVIKILILFVNSSWPDSKYIAHWSWSHCSNQCVIANINRYLVCHPWNYLKYLNNNQLWYFKCVHF